jgi:hypothetical protein
MFKWSFKILITKNTHLCKMWRHLMQNTYIIHFNTKMQKILFQVCKRMNFLLNCRFFYLHQSKLWGKHIHKNSRMMFFISLSFFHGGTRWRKHLALMQSWNQTWCVTMMFASTQVFKFEFLLFITKNPSGHNVYQVQIQQKKRYF